MSLEDMRLQLSSKEQNDQERNHATLVSGSDCGCPGFFVCVCLFHFYKKGSSSFAMAVELTKEHP